MIVLADLTQAGNHPTRAPDMDTYTNFTRTSWLATIDSLQDSLEAARQVPPWAVVVICLCGLSLLSLLVIFGFACGLFVQQHIQAEERENRLLNSDSVNRDGEVQLEDNIEMTTEVGPTSMRKGKERVVCVDDMEL